MRGIPARACSALLRVSTTCTSLSCRICSPEKKFWRAIMDHFGVENEVSVPYCDRASRRTLFFGLPFPSRAKAVSFTTHSLRRHSPCSRLRGLSRWARMADSTQSYVFVRAQQKRSKAKERRVPELQNSPPTRSRLREVLRLFDAKPQREGIVLCAAGKKVDTGHRRVKIARRAPFKGRHALSWRVILRHSAFKCGARRDNRERQRHPSQSMVAAR